MKIHRVQFVAAGTKGKKSSWRERERTCFVHNFKQILVNMPYTHPVSVEIKSILK